MKKVLFSLYLFSIFSYSQIHEPIKWSTTSKKISKNIYEIIFMATIEDEWHLYSKDLPEDGPLPTVIKITPDESFQIIDELWEGEGKLVYEEIFELELKYFENEAVFKQRVKILEKNKPIKIKGNIQFMSCNSQSCIPGYTEFQINL